MSNYSSAAIPRNMATVAKGGVIFGAGLAFGLLTIQMHQPGTVSADGSHVVSRDAESGQEDAATTQRKDDGASKPIIVYRAPTASGGGYTPSNGSSSSGTAPQPAPAQAPAAATSTAS